MASPYSEAKALALLNVLLDVSPASGGHGARGIGRYVRGLVDAVDAMTPERRERIWALGLPGDTLARFGSRAIPSRLLGVRPPDLGLLLGPPLVRRAVHRSAARVFHATDPHHPLFRANAPQVVTVYDLIPLREEGRVASWRPNQRLTYRRYLEQVRSAAMVAAISRATAQDIQEWLDVPSERVTIVSPVVTPPMDFVRAPADPSTFLAVGALDSHKQPQLAVEALAHFRAARADGRLRFIGPSSERQRAQLLEHARRLGIADFIAIDGRVSEKELDAAYASAAALLMTSRIEGFGLPAVEAVLRGVPVISVDTPAARETVGDAAVLVVGDPERIAEAMMDPRPPSAEAQHRLRSSHTALAVSKQLSDAWDGVDAQPTIGR